MPFPMTEKKKQPLDIITLGAAKRRKKFFLKRYSTISYEGVDMLENKVTDSLRDKLNFGIGRKGQGRPNN